MGDADQMHGIGTIEDSQYIHENVIFKRGKCQMPFTLMGPPVSGFDSHLIFGPVMKGVQAAKSKQNASNKDVRPDATKAGQAKDLVDNATTRLSASEHKRGFGAMAAPEDAAVIREDTDLTLPEEDLWIVGGTGPNELMNGTYWKLSS